MYERVLIAYDASESARRALEAGVQLAHATGARVTVFHNLIEGPVPAAFFNAVPERLQQAGDADGDESWASSYSSLYYDTWELSGGQLKEVAVELLAHAGTRLEAHGITDYDAQIGTGDAGYNILEYARENRIDTIVVGSRGHGRLTGLVLGSVSRKILHGFDGCTLIVR